MIIKGHFPWNVSQLPPVVLKVHPHSHKSVPKIMNLKFDYFNSLVANTLFRTASSRLPTLLLRFKTSKQPEQHKSNFRHKRLQNLRRSIFRKTSFKHSTQISCYRSHLTSIPQKKKKRKKKKISSVQKKKNIANKRRRPQKKNRSFLKNSVCSSVPQINLMLCKRTDSEVELIANLHIHITNIAFRSLLNTPKS